MPLPKIIRRWKCPQQGHTAYHDKSIWWYICLSGWILFSSWHSICSWQKKPSSETQNFNWLKLKAKWCSGKHELQNHSSSRETSKLYLHLRTQHHQQYTWHGSQDSVHPICSNLPHPSASTTPNFIISYYLKDEALEITSVGLVLPDSDTTWVHIMKFYIFSIPIGYMYYLRFWKYLCFWYHSRLYTIPKPGKITLILIWNWPK